MSNAEKFLAEVKARADATYSDGSRIDDGSLAARVARIRRTLHGGLPDLLTGEKADLIQVIEQYRAARTDIPRLVAMVECLRRQRDEMLSNCFDSTYATEFRNKCDIELDRLAGDGA